MLLCVIASALAAPVTVAVIGDYGTNEPGADTVAALVASWKPELIATYPTGKPALSLSKGLERDRGVDETGGQIAVFGRRGSRPLNLQEMRKLFLDANGKPWYVTDQVEQRVSRE